MKKYFLYELKKNWLAILMITVFACIIYLTAIFAENFAPLIFDSLDYIYIPFSRIDIPFTMLTLLCTAVPVWMFSFKTSVRQCDLHFSSPLSRKKLYLVKSVTGLVIIFVSYTIAYWLGFAATALKENMFVLAEFVPAYFVSVLFGTLLFGVNAFAFTRANNFVDGIIFVVLYAFASSLFIMLIIQCVRFSDGWLYDTFMSLLREQRDYNVLRVFSDRYLDIISQQSVNNNFLWLRCIFAAVVGVAAWSGLFLTARKEKTENAEKISDSKFGYVTLIPYCTFFSVLLLGLNRSSEFLALVLIIAAALIAYVVFRRSLKLKKSDWIAFGIAVLLGIIFAVIKFQIASYHAEKLREMLYW